MAANGAGVGVGSDGVAVAGSAVGCGVSVDAAGVLLQPEVISTAARMTKVKMRFLELIG